MMDLGPKLVFSGQIWLQFQFIFIMSTVFNCVVVDVNLSMALERQHGYEKG